MTALAASTWPADRVGEALEVLAGRLSSPRAARSSPAPAPDPRDLPGFQRWIDAAAAALELEVEPIDAAHKDVGAMLRGAAPALVRLDRPDVVPGYLVLCVGGPRRVLLLGPDLIRRHVPLEDVRAALCATTEAPLVTATERLLTDAAVPNRHRARARAALLSQRLQGTSVGGVYLLRYAPEVPFVKQARAAGLGMRLALAVGAHLAQYLLWLLSWVIVGHAALAGRVSMGWMLGWVLLMGTIVPLRLYATWAAGRFGIETGALLKQRLLAGALRMPQDQLRKEGVGQLMGRVIESDSIESLVLSGGFQAGLASLELLVALPVLFAGGGLLLAGLALAWIALVLAFVAVSYRRRRIWTETRRHLTHELVETMTGHRTRLVQQPREDWHLDEDVALERNVEAARGLDRAMANLATFGIRGWLLLGVAALVPTLLARAAPLGMALGVGGVMLTYGALRRLVNGLGSLGGAWIAWTHVAPLFSAAANRDGLPATVAEPAVSHGLLEAEQLVYRYPGRLEPVLRGASLRLAPGTRLLLQGSSGGGKSTLGALLTGLRVPDGGTLLLDGMDLHTLGSERWRRRVASAPQFHENHVLSATLAFNLLMGRSWPPHQADLELAEAICRELGLGPLLERMPAGLSQMVGETGWQLSHGERSRLYIARALLQRADVVVLDESFASLDPATLAQAMACVNTRARALLVIAHP